LARRGYEEEEVANNKHMLPKKKRRMCGVSHLNWLMIRQWNDTFSPRTFFVLPEERTQTAKWNWFVSKKGVYTSLQLSQRFTFAYPKKEREMLFICTHNINRHTKKLVVRFRPTILYVTRIPSSNILSQLLIVVVVWAYHFLYNCSFPWVSSMNE
jgi:hypothetical protein